MEKQEIRKRILNIQEELHIKDSGMAILMGVKLNTYKNCKSDLKDRNHFNLFNLESILKNLKNKLDTI